MSIKFNKPYLVNNPPRVMRRQTRVPTALAEATMSTWVLGRSAGSLTGSASGGKPKGNVDAELVLQAMIDYRDYERAVIVTSDGDFACLVRYLYGEGKLERVLSPNRKGCSVLLKRAARERVDFLEDARRKLEYKSEGAPPQDGT